MATAANAMDVRPDNALKIYETFLLSGNHYINGPEEKRYAKNPAKCYSFYIIGNKLDLEKVYLAHSEKGGIHAEDRMLQFLSVLFEKEKEKETIYVYTNYSPCERCAQNLLKFAEENKVRFSIMFASLYRCDRLSDTHYKCTIGNCCRFKNKENQEQLANLIKSKYFTLSTFTKDTWVQLFYIMSKHYVQGDGHDTRIMSQYTLYTRMNNEFKVLKENRDREDEKMRDDFIKLFRSPDISGSSSSMVSSDEETPGESTINALTESLQGHRRREETRESAEEYTAKVSFLKKRHEEYGFDLKGGRITTVERQGRRFKESTPVFIGKVFEGLAAERNGLRCGDEIIAVSVEADDGKERHLLRGKSHNEAISIFRKFIDRELVFFELIRVN